MEGQGPNIALAPEVIAQIGGFSLLNTHITFSLISILVMILLIVASSRFASKPSKFQIVVEGMHNFFYSKIDATGLETWKKKALLSIVLTLFIIIIISNVFTIAPFLSSIIVATGVGDVPLLRSPTSHFALPIALGLFVVILANAAAIIIAPVRYVGGFIKIGPLLRARTPGAVAMGFLDIFLGFMDLISEIAKVISISARLFGNIIAGEIIAKVMLFLVPFIIPIPFFLISLFSGVIQAFVFALLSMQFIAGSTQAVRKEAIES